MGNPLAKRPLHFEKKKKYVDSLIARILCLDNLKKAEFGEIPKINSLISINN